MNTAEKNTYQDVAHASAALKWTVNKIESYLNKCLNVKDGQCRLTWKHEDCRVLMEILYEITGDNKYKEAEWLFDPDQKLLWD